MPVTAFQIMKLSQHQERDVERELSAIYPGARRQPGSGNIPDQPNDVYVPEHFFVECKLTTKLSMIMPLAWFERALRKSVSYGVRAILALRFVDINGRNNGVHRDYVVVEKEFFYHLLECEKQVDQH